MFFSYQILIRKNSHFAVIWRHMHDRRLSKEKKEELKNVDIGQACADLRDYVPSGKLEASEVLNKMSLYLLAQLSYGVTLVLNVQADILIENLQSLLRDLTRVPVTGTGEGTVRKKRESGGRRKRKADDDDDEELDLGDYQQMEAILAETGAVGKRRRSSRTTKGPSLLNLSDPRSYVDQQVPSRGRRTEAEQQFGEQDELDQMFHDTDNTRLPPAEWGLREDQQKKISTASIMPGQGEESFMRELERIESQMGEVGMAGDQPLSPPPPTQQSPSNMVVPASPDEFAFEEGNLELEPPIEEPRDDFEPLYRRATSFSKEQLRRSIDELQLEALPDLVAPRARPQRHRNRHLIIDARTQLSTDQILRNLEDNSDLLRTSEQLRHERIQRQLPTVKELFDPVPRHILGLNKELHPLFQSVLKNVQEHPLTYDEALRMDDEDMRKRHYENVELASEHTSELKLDETLQRAGEDQNQTQDTIQAALQGIDMAPPPDKVPERQKISFAELGQPADEPILEDVEPPPRPSTPLGPEQTRAARDTIQRTMSGRPTEPTPQQLLDESYFQPPMEMEVSMDVAGLEDMPLQRESILTKPSPDQPEEGWLDAEMDNLLGAIVSKQKKNESGQESGQEFTTFNEVVDPGMSRKQVARRFFTLLKLLKHGKVRARQQKCFHPILLRAPNKKGLDDTSMALSEYEA